MTQVLDYEQTDEQEGMPAVLATYFASIGGKGGNATVARHGKQQFSEMGRKAQANKAKRKYENTQDVSL